MPEAQGSRSKRRRLLVLVGVALGTFCAVYLFWRGKRWLDADRAAAILQLQTPVTVSQVRIFEDGGSIGFVLTGGSGSTLLCCVDGRSVTKSPGQLFIGAEYLTDTGAMAVRRGSPTERAVVVLLQEYLDQNYTRPYQWYLLWKGSIVGLNRQERDALYMLWAIRAMESRR
mgnify:CR=1 FL=1